MILELRRKMAETPAFFDMIRARWQREQRAKCVQPKRDESGRYARAN
ncbi:hypothetical protein [Sphingobium olei]|uniref:Uncharacterized protein n=1 Tax=Sphingobium olei TaxID=420955 RepID=A0ABW3NZ07_9SPHN